MTLKRSRRGRKPLAAPLSSAHIINSAFSRRLKILKYSKKLSKLFHQFYTKNYSLVLFFFFYDSLLPVLVNFKSIFF